MGFNFNSLKNMINNSVKDIVDEKIKDAIGINNNEIHSTSQPTPHVETSNTTTNNYNTTPNVETYTNDENIVIETVPEVVVTPRNEYSEIKLLGDSTKVRFKQAEPTYFWDSNDNFGAGEIDDVLLVSENGAEIQASFGNGNTSAIIFQLGESATADINKIKSNLSRWYGITKCKIEKPDHNIYFRKITGSSSNTYYEAYSFNYELEGDKIDYKIELILYKNNYTEEQCSKIVSEFHQIINTLEIVNE